MHFLAIEGVTGQEKAIGEAVAKALEGKLPLSAPKMVYLPKTTVLVAGEVAEKVIRLVESLEENDDVQHVWANLEMDDKTMEALSS